MTSPLTDCVPKSRFHELESNGEVNLQLLWFMLASVVGFLWKVTDENNPMTKNRLFAVTLRNSDSGFLEQILNRH